MKKKYALTSAIVSFFYLAVIGATGLFGQTVQNAILTIAPYFFSILGLFLVIVVPYRVMWAMDRNREIRQKIEEEKRMAKIAADNKKLKKQAMKYDMDEMY